MLTVSINQLTVLLNTLNNWWSSKHYYIKICLYKNCTYHAVVLVHSNTANNAQTRIYCNVKIYEATVPTHTEIFENMTK